jgi:hypothetical protein
MSIKLTNQSTKDADEITEKAKKRDHVFQILVGNDDTIDAAAGAYEEIEVGDVTERGTADDVGNTANHGRAITTLNNMRLHLNGHASYTFATAITAATVTANVSAVEDVIDDFLGGSHSAAFDVIGEVAVQGVLPNGSDHADLAADLKAFADAQDAGSEATETTASINTTASLGVAMSAGDGWTASTSGSFNLGGGSVSGGTLSLSNGTMTLSVGKTQHAATAAVSSMFGMDVALDTNSADTQLQATLALGGATLQVDNEMDGDNLEPTNQTVGIKGSYGTMSYGLGWQADGDLGFSLGTTLGGIGLTISRVNAGANYSMGLAAAVDLGGGMTLNATNAQNSDGLQDKSFDYATVTVSAAGVGSAVGGATITEHFALKAVHKSISTVGLSYAGGGTSVGITYQEKAGTSAAGDNLIASGSMAISPTITLTGSYNKDSAVTTIGASGPLGSAGTLSAVMTSTGSSTLTASFKF